MAILCQFDVKMPLGDLYFFNMGVTFLNNVKNNCKISKKVHPLLIYHIKGISSIVLVWWKSNAQAASVCPCLDLAPLVVPGQDTSNRP